MTYAESSAHPYEHHTVDDLGHPMTIRCIGLTKREYFSAMAMQGYLGSYAGATVDPEPDVIAKKAIEYADALIQALNETK